MQLDEIIFVCGASIAATAVNLADDNGGRRG